jgi:hypothetical protein
LVLSVNETKQEKHMPVKKRTKNIKKAAACEKTIATALSNLDAVLSDVTKAAGVRAAQARKLTAESKRLAKKRATLMKRRKSTAAKLKKAPDADMRKKLRETEKELTRVKKLSVTNRAAKSANSEELRELKSQMKRTRAYNKALAAADKALNKPRRKKRRKRRAAA